MTGRHQFGIAVGKMKMGWVKGHQKGTKGHTYCATQTSQQADKLINPQPIRGYKPRDTAPIFDMDDYTLWVHGQKITSKQQEIIQLYYYGGKTEQWLMEQYGWTQQVMTLINWDTIKLANSGQNYAPECNDPK